MKKLLLLTASAVITLSAMAQGPVIKDPNFRPFKADDSNIESLKKTSKGDLRKAVSDWYDFPEYISNNAPSGADIKNYASFIFPDSTVQFISANEAPFFWGEHSTGFTWDPKDDLWSTAGFDFFQGKDSYTVDSLAMLYIYRRNNADVNVVDTLYLDVYQNTALTRGSFTTQVGNYAKPNFDYNTVSGQNRTVRKTVLLGAADTTTFSGNGWGFGIMTEFIGMNVAGNAAANTSIFSFTITFKPGHAFSVGDTMEISDITKPRPANGVNYFGYRLTRNEGEDNTQIRNEYFNHSTIVLKQTRYPGTNLNGWTGYMPGNSFFEIRYMETFAHISGNSTVSAAELNQFGASLGKAFPNPAKSGGEINIEMGLTKNTEVKFELVNLLGQVVASKSLALEAGEHRVPMSLQNVRPGIYMYTMSTSDYSSSRKVTVME